MHEIKIEKFFLVTKPAAIEDSESHTTSAVLRFDPYRDLYSIIFVWDYIAKFRLGADSYHKEKEWMH